MARRSWSCWPTSRAPGNKLAYVNELTTAYAAIESATALVDAPRDLDFFFGGGLWPGAQSHSNHTVTH